MTSYENSGLTVKKACYLLLRFFAYSIVISIPLVFGKEFITNHVEYPLVTSFVSLLMYVLPFLLVIRVGLKWIQKDILSDMKEEFTRIDYGVLLLAFLLTPLIGVQHDVLTSNLLPPPPEFLNKVSEDLLKPNFISFVAIAVAPAILEEILCRGIILEGLLQRYSPPKAILWSAVLFGAMHLNPWQFITGFIIGLFIGWLYYRTKSVYPGILVHFVNYAIAYLTWLIWGEEVASFEEVVTSPTYYMMVAVSLVLCVAGIWYLNKRMPKKPEIALNEYSEEKVYI